MRKNLDKRKMTGLLIVMIIFLSLYTQTAFSNTFSQQQSNLIIDESSSIAKSEGPVVLKEEYEDDYVLANLFHTIDVKDRERLQAFGMDFAISCNPIEHEYICSDRQYVYNIKLNSGLIVVCKNIDGTSMTINDMFDSMTK